jgi:hypothetical protein
MSQAVQLVNVQKSIVFHPLYEENKRNRRESSTLRNHKLFMLDNLKVCGQSLNNLL